MDVNTGGLTLFLAVLGLHRCLQAFSGCGQRGLLFAAVRGLLVAVLLLLQSVGSGCENFSSCSRWTQYLQLPGSRAQAQ